MRIDSHNAWITRATAAGPSDYAEIIKEGLDETVGKILHVFDDMSAIDLPLMITALRTAERGLSNCTIAKSTHALLAADVIDRMFRPEFGETQIAVPKELLDKLENKETEGKS